MASSAAEEAVASVAWPAWAAEEAVASAETSPSALEARLQSLQQGLQCDGYDSGGGPPATGGSTPGSPAGAGSSDTPPARWTSARSSKISGSSSGLPTCARSPRISSLLAL